MATASIPDLIQAAAQRYGVPFEIAQEVAIAESGMNPNVHDSPAGAIGVMQLLPSTAADLGVDPRDPAQNVDGGVRYLSQLLGRYGGDAVAAVAAYDWGMGHVDAAIAEYGDFSVTLPGSLPMPAWLASAPAETQDYVKKVLGNVATQYTYAPAAPSGGTTSTAPNPVPQAPPNAPGSPSGAPQGADMTTVLVMAGIALLFLWAGSESFS